MSDIFARVIGRLTKDPTINTVGGNTVCNFTVAARSSAKNESGEYASEFFTVSVWGKQGEYIAKSATKGTLVLVEGDFSTRKYVGRDGQTQTAMNVNNANCRIFHAGSSQSGTQDGAAYSPANKAPAPPKPSAPPSDPDELPF